MGKVARAIARRALCGVPAALLLVQSGEAAAQTPPRVEIRVEAGAVWSNRNDVRIPPDTGTGFSIVDLIGSGPSGALRAEAILRLAERHELKAVYAPLRVSGRGTPDAPIAFAGAQFAPVPTDADYEFSSYRATYRYRFYRGDTWSWRVGFTGFVRDARVALSQAGAAAEDTDVGFVPLGHVSGTARLGERWTLALELDGAAAPQGRAFDFSAFLDYRVTNRWALAAGYRTIEGGADVEEVFTFAWLNALAGRIRFLF